LNGTTGKVLWKYAVSGFPVESPVVANGLVYISTSVLIALNENTGKLVWSYVSPNNHGPGCPSNGCTAEVSPVAATNADVFFSDGYGNLLALNALTGQSVWSFEDNGVGLNIELTPIVANGIVYAGGAEQDPTGSVIYAFSESTRTTLWWQQDNASTNIGTSPVVVNGLLFFGTGEDAGMWAYRL
jgi:outer membrane protein assembly factor BamB